MSSENRKTLLLVEDEAIIAIAQKKTLEKYGYKVITANDGERAINVFSENNDIDLILMDIDLGKSIDGTETAKRILAQHNLPVVFLSSHTEPEIVEKTEKITSYGYVVKNSGITVLDASIKMAFKLFDANRKIEESEAAIRKKLDAIIEPDGDIGTLELADIIDSESLQAMMNDFYALTKIGVGVLDINGKVLVGAGWQDICTEFHRSNPETLKNCIESDVFLSKGIVEGEFKTYRCKNGMWDMMTPVVIGGKHLGNISLGQFFYDDEIPDYEFFRSQARKFGFDEKEYMSAVDRVARFSHETVNATMSFYAKLASMISSLSYSKVNLSRTLSQKDSAMQKLEESEVTKDAMISNISDVIGIIGADSITRYKSPNIEKWFGWKPEDLIGTDVWLTVHPDDLERMKKVFFTLLEKDNSSQIVELRYKCRDGSYKPIELTAANLVNNRNVRGMLVNYHDISYRKSAEEELKNKNEELESLNEELNAALEEMEAANEELIAASEELQAKEKALISEKAFIEALLDCIPGYLYVYDDQANLIRWNKKHEEMTGYSAEELSQMNMSKWFEGEDAVKVAAAVEEVFRTGYGEVEANLLIKGGKKLLIHSNGVRLNIEGKTYFTGVGVDITERKRAEEEIKKSQMLLKSSIESPKDIIILSIDNQYNYLYFNSYHKSVMKNAYGVDVAIGMNILECITNDQDRIKAGINYGRALSGESHITIEEFGELDRQYYETRYNPIVNDLNEVIGATAFSANVTGRIRMQNELLKSERKFDTMFQTMVDGMVTVDLSGRIIYSNKAAGKILSIGKDVLGKDYKSREWRQLDENGDLYPLEQLPLAVAMREQREVLNVEHQIEASDGERKWLSVNAAPLFDDAGKLSGGVASFRDITENKRLVEELKKNKRRFEQLIKNSSDTIVILDADGIQLYVSDAVERILGYKPDELINIPVIKEMIHPDDIEKTQAAFMEIITKGYGGTQYRHRHKSGGWIYLEGWGTNQLDNPDIRGVVVNARDITERKHAEEAIQLDEARLESLLKINQHPAENIQDLLDFALNEGIVLTGSKIGYIYFYDEDKKEFLLNTWSKEVMPQCGIADKQTVYQLEKTGLWGEAVRQRRPIIENDFAAPNHLRKGLPEGHNPLERFLTIPVIINAQIAAVIGVANKESDYNDSDIRQLNLMMDAVWKIVQRKIAEENVQKLLREKELILHEVHHRIKNNMNTIHGLLKLQADAQDNPEISNVLFDAESRVISMMVLYDRLYRSDDFKSISIINYIPALADEILSNFPSGKKVKIIKKLDDFVLDVKILQPLGIIINELLTNIMKYAFINREDGVITISSEKKGSHITITIQDNGVGIPESIQIENSTGFGMQLVVMLTEQIGGSIRIERGEGTKFILEFDV